MLARRSSARLRSVHERHYTNVSEAHQRELDAPSARRRRQCFLSEARWLAADQTDGGAAT